MFSKRVCFKGWEKRREKFIFYAASIELEADELRWNVCNSWAAGQLRANYLNDVFCPLMYEYCILSAKEDGYPSRFQICRLGWESKSFSFSFEPFKCNDTGTVGIFERYPTDWIFGDEQIRSMRRDVSIYGTSYMLKRLTKMVRVAITLYYVDVYIRDFLFRNPLGTALQVALGNSSKAIYSQCRSRIIRFGRVLITL